MLFRTEINVQTGEQTSVQQIAYRDQANNILVLDVDVAPPEGFYEADLSELPEMQVVPISVTRRQARLALLQAGILPSVESAISAIEDPTEQMAAQIEYESELWERRNPWIDRTGFAIGLTTEDIDQLFITAASL